MNKALDEKIQPKLPRIVQSRYYFHGEGEYKPAIIVASTLQEATAIYEKTKKPLT